MLNQHKFHSYGFERGRWKSTQTISFACSSSSCSTPGELTSMETWPSAELSSCPRLCCSFICRFSFSNSSKESLDKKKTRKRKSRCHKAWQPSMLEVPFSILRLQVVFPIFALQFLTQSCNRRLIDSSCWVTVALNFACKHGAISKQRKSFKLLSMASCCWHLQLCCCCPCSSQVLLKPLSLAHTMDDGTTLQPSERKRTKNERDFEKNTY